MKLTRIGKTSAMTLTMKGITVLFSYETPVAYCYHEKGIVYVTDKKWSVTTSKHINVFVKMYCRPFESPTIISQDMLDAMFGGDK